MAAHDTFGYDITAIEVISSTGLATNIKFMVQDFNIYESVFNSVLSGDAYIWDGQNILSDGNLHGNEYLLVKFEKAGLTPIEKYFRIYKISDVRFRNSTSLEYVIHFCSEEFVLNQQKRISKSYKTVKNHQIVRDILENQLKVNPKKIVAIEDTVIEQNLIIPGLKPLEAINWLSTFSLNGKLSAAFLFYENFSGFVFKSLASMYEEQPVKKLQISPKNVISEEEKSIVNSNIVDRIEIPSYFDILKAITLGGYSSKMFAINLIDREYAILRYDSVQGNFDQLNKFVPYNESLNRFDETLTDGSTYIRFFPTFQGALVDDWLLQRASQIALLNNMQVNLQIPGDPELKVGSVIELDFPAIQPIDAPSKTEEDLIKSGKYLITGIRHRIIDSVYICYLELCKDSNKGGIPSPTNSVKYDTAKKA